MRSVVYMEATDHNVMVWPYGWLSEYIQEDVPLQVNVAHTNNHRLHECITRSHWRTIKYAIESRRWQSRLPLIVLLVDDSQSSILTLLRLDLFWCVLYTPWSQILMAIENPASDFKNIHFTNFYINCCCRQWNFNRIYQRAKRGDGILNK